MSAGATEKSAELDFNAVQRGDAEMEQKLNRLIRACIELGPARNPILSIHDQGIRLCEYYLNAWSSIVRVQGVVLAVPTVICSPYSDLEYSTLILSRNSVAGAGGNGNVLKEIVSPAGARIEADAFTLGDPSVSLRELWNAEYQESDAILLAAPVHARQYGPNLSFFHFSSSQFEFHSGLNQSDAVRIGHRATSGDSESRDLISGAESAEGAERLIRRAARRERCGLDIVGTVTGEGRVRYAPYVRVHVYEYITHSYIRIYESLYTRRVLTLVT